MACNSSVCSLFVNTASSGWLLWTCSLKKDEFHHFTVTIRVSRVNRVSMVRVRVSLVLAIGWG